MDIEYSKEELTNIIETVRAAEHTDDLPIHNWARAAKVLDDVAASRLELLKQIKYLLTSMQENWREQQLFDIYNLIEKELGDD